MAINKCKYEKYLELPTAFNEEKLGKIVDLKNLNNKK